MERKTSLKEPEEIVELSYLYDFYGALLGDKQREIFEDYILNDLSLGEIAVERQMTRQGGYDIVRRARIKLREYEERLQLVYKFRQTRERLEQIEAIAGAGADRETAGAITRLAEEIYDII